MIPRQAVVLCGGYGTRLGPLTARRPKPLLEVGGVPFLSILIGELARQGVRKVLLLAAFEADQIEAFAMEERDRRPRPIDIEVLREDVPAGTGGALRQAKAALDPQFVMLNGDSWFDVLIADVAQALKDNPGALGALALRRVDDGGRYGAVHLEGSRVTKFEERGEGAGPALINGGVYVFERDIVERLPLNGSLERETLPQLARDGRLAGVQKDGFFIDIGVPDDFAKAQTEVPAQRRRPALIFDRDGVINRDHGHVGSIDRLEWMPGAAEAVRLVNEAGWFAFIATNQAGIGKGYYSEADYMTLQDHMHNVLGDSGAHIDEEVYCATHPEAVVSELKMESNRRKPGPGMLLELRDRWPVDWESSVMIGDKATDMEAAKAAGIAGVLFDGGDLVSMVRRVLDGAR